MKALRVLVLVSIINALLLPSPLKSQTTSDDSFRPYLSCSFDDGLKVVDTIHYLKSSEKFRELNTPSGKRKVTYLDGYTVKFAYPNTDVFVNLKVEQSSPRSYDRDKEIIIENMKWLLSRGKAVDEKEPKKVTVNGVEIYGFDRNILGFGIVMGMHLFFEDKNHKVITVYFLNQKPERRKPQTLAEYRALRDKFLNQYTKCVTSRQ